MTITKFSQLVKLVNEEFYKDGDTLKFTTDSNDDNVLKFTDSLTTVKGDNSTFIRNRGLSQGNWHRVYYGYDVVDDTDMRKSVMRIPKTFTSGSADPKSYDSNINTTHYDYDAFTDKEYQMLIDRAIDGFVSKPYTAKTHYNLIVYPSSRSPHVMDIVQSIQNKIGYELPAIEHKKIPNTTTGWKQIFGLNDPDNSKNIVNTLYNKIFGDANHSSNVAATAKTEINDAANAVMTNHKSNDDKYISVATHLRGAGEPVLIQQIIDALNQNGFFEKFPGAKQPKLGGHLDQYATNSVFRQERLNKKLGEDQLNILFVDDNINTGDTYKQLQAVITKSPDQHWDFFYLIKKESYGNTEGDIGTGEIEQLESQKVSISKTISDLNLRLKKLNDVENFSSMDLGLSDMRREKEQKEKTNQLESLTNQLAELEKKIKQLSWQRE
jgi:hypoxanthine phosphoribosyltransferase